jgi:hypothetical protein
MKVKLNEQQLQKLAEWLKVDSKSILEEGFKPYYEIDTPRASKSKDIELEIPAMKKRGRPRKNPLDTPTTEPISGEIKRRGRPRMDLGSEPKIPSPLGSRGRPANTEKIIDKFKSYLDRNIFSTQQLNDLGELILNAVVNSKSK